MAETPLRHAQSVSQIIHAIQTGQEEGKPPMSLLPHPHCGLANLTCRNFASLAQTRRSVNQSRHNNLPSPTFRQVNLIWPKSAQPPALPMAHAHAHLTPNCHVPAGRTKCPQTGCSPRELTKPHNTQQEFCFYDYFRLLLIHHRRLKLSS